MKLKINKSPDIAETQVQIDCREEDRQVRQLAAYIKSFADSIECELEGAGYRIALCDIFYAESVDQRTYVATESETYRYRGSLTELEEALQKRYFCRISKSCILNLDQLKCVAPYANHRLKATLKNGENLLVSRSYIKTLKEKVCGRNNERMGN